MRKGIFGYLCLLGCIAPFLLLSATGLLRAQTAQPSLGLFQNHADIGTVLHAGSAQYDAAHHTYTLTGSGENMWFTSDAFQFAWKQVSGDITLTADIAFPEKGGNPHRKAVLMIRQSLDADSPYADVALHGDGLTSLQFRDAKGSTTHEIESNLSAPHRLRIEKRGDFIYVFLASAAGEPLHPSGASIKLPLQGSFYVGIGVCSHDKDVVEKAVFSNVEPRNSRHQHRAARPLQHAGDGVHRLHRSPRGLHRRQPLRGAQLDATTARPSSSTARATSCACPLTAARPRPSTPASPPIATTTTASRRTRNGWRSAIPRSPTSSRACTSCPSAAARLASSRRIPRPTGTAGRPTARPSPSSAQRNGEFDIYTIPVAGGDETRLTTAKGLDDGPEYSPDGKYIYFNSERTGHMQIWRMHADGSAQEQITFDDFNNWFPHISPDGKWMVFLSYGNDVTGHPPNKDVQLRIMSAERRKDHGPRQAFRRTGHDQRPLLVAG